ncbi:hypothetical protein ABMA27_016818 [Loxostege sticticalis]|uniref:Uncharacterized protein n=1 Tax=Loxostege sticticalis TaxID=481309 RepID=A0ABR3I3P6_LOXSC
MELVPEVSAKLVLEVEVKPCRCEFVHKWLDDHVKYFPPLPPQPAPKVITRLCAYTYGPAQIHYYYSQPVEAVYTPRNIQLPYIMPAPHRISPLRPMYH